MSRANADAKAIVARATKSAEELTRSAETEAQDTLANAYESLGDKPKAVKTWLRLSAVVAEARDKEQCAKIRLRLNPYMDNPEVFAVAKQLDLVAGAAANDLPGAVPEEVKEERYARVMEKTAAISAAKLQAKVGRTLDVIIDLADSEGGATGRSYADAPEIDGEVHLRDAPHAKAGDILKVLVEEADEHDLFGVPINA